MKLSMTLWELGILALVSAGIGAGIHSGYVSRIIDDCHELARERTGALYDQHVARAFEFAKCMSKSKYDPMYDVDRFKGK